MSEGPDDPKASKRDKAIANLFHALGWFGLYVGIAEPFIQYFIVGGPVSNPIACVVATIIGLLLHGIAYAWPPSKPEVRAFWTRLILPLVRRRRSLAVGGFLALWTILLFQVLSIRNDLTMYVMPRTVSSSQASFVRQHLAHGKAWPITIKVNPLDHEALEFAGQIFNIFQKTEWQAALDVSNKEPLPLNDGLSIQEFGSASNPDPKHDPGDVLQQAFMDAGIPFSSTGTVSAGTFGLYLLVGHRPFSLGEKPPLLARFGRWLQQLDIGS